MNSIMNLHQKDPHRADDVDNINKVRLIRALEIVAELGHVPPLHEPKLVYETEMYLMKPLTRAYTPENRAKTSCQTRETECSTNAETLNKTQ